MDSSSTAHVSEQGAESGAFQQTEKFETEAPLTAQSLPYAFAKRHGVLIGQIEEDVVNVLYHSAPDPIVLAEVSRIARRNISLVLSRRSVCGVTCADL